MTRRRTVLLGLLAGASLATAGRAAESKGSVVVYTAHLASIVDALVPRFQKETGITANVVKAGSGDIVRRVRAEAGTPRADVIWSIGGEELDANSDLLQPYAPREAASLDPTFRGGKSWLPYSGIVNVFMVNTDMVKRPDFPKSWQDLADPRWKGRISMARADASGSSFMQLATVLSIYGDDAKGWDVYGKILGDTVLSDSSGAVPRFVNDGEQPVGVTLEDNALNYVRGGGPVSIVYPADGTSVGADGIALVKGAPNEANGKAFIDWCLSKDTQAFLVSQIGRRSVRKDVPPGQGVPLLADVKTVNYDLQWAAAHRTELLRKWTELAHAH